MGIKTLWEKSLKIWFPYKTKPMDSKKLVVNPKYCNIRTFKDIDNNKIPSTVMEPIYLWDPYHK